MTFTVMKNTLKILLSMVIFLKLTIGWSQETNSDTTGNLIVDSFELFPFEVQTLSKEISICHDGVGKAIIRLHINNIGTITSYEIVRLNFVDNKKNYFFSNPKNEKRIRYPSIIKSNKKFFDSFVKNQISVKKVNDIQPKDENIFLIPINLK
jgi:hypothetical protein